MLDPAFDRTGTSSRKQAVKAGTPAKVALPKAVRWKTCALARLTRSEDIARRGAAPPALPLSGRKTDERSENRGGPLTDEGWQKEMSVSY